MPDTTNLKRKIQPMPDDVRRALEERSLLQAYNQRPAYQRNDYLLWIGSAKGEATRAKRLNQMLEELARGGVYMNMPHKPSA